MFCVVMPAQRTYMRTLPAVDDVCFLCLYFAPLKGLQGFHWEIDIRALTCGPDGYNISHTEAKMFIGMYQTSA